MNGRRHALLAGFDARYVEVQCGTDALAAALQIRLGHLVSASRPALRVVLRVAVDEIAPSCLELRDDGGRCAAGSFDHVLHHLRKWMVAAFAAARPDLFWLHASGAERDGFVMLIAGPAGVGKSTLVVRLIESGWRLLGDDIVPIRPGTWQALPLPFTPAVRMSVPQGDHQAFLAQTKTVVPVAVGDVAGGAGRVGAIVFPRYVDGVVIAPELVSLSVVAAAQRLFPQCAYRGADGLATLTVAFECARQVPCYALQYTDARMAAAAAELAVHSALHPRRRVHRRGQAVSGRD